VRWRHPGLGLLPPDSFIPLAERSGLIQPLTAWVLDAALRQAGAWRSAGRPIPVAINLSIANLWNPLLAAEIQRLARRWQVPLSDVTLELTENFVMADPDQARAVLSGLRNLGVRVALDDFGMGQSSLTWLHQLPVDEIKIDKSFVMDMADDEYGTALVRLAAETGHQLGLQVVAEGVDRLETLDLLLSLGCDAAQGHAICPPVPAAELEDWANARV
ncbi:MAG: EAL domain-containing protein, partial [Chloroflexi bacterium]|nr:EAL domain-containing protein [Chloroflexota bacterium]